MVIKVNLKALESVSNRNLLVLSFRHFATRLKVLVTAGAVSISASMLFIVTGTVVATPAVWMIADTHAQDSDFSDLVEADDDSGTQQPQSGRFRESLRERAGVKSRERTPTHSNSPQLDQSKKAVSGAAERSPVINQQEAKDREGALTMRTPKAEPATNPSSNPLGSPSVAMTIAPTVGRGNTAAPKTSPLPLRTELPKNPSDYLAERQNPILNQIPHQIPSQSLSRKVNQELQGDSRLIYRIFSSEFAPRRAKFVISFVDGSTRLENATVISLSPAPSRSSAGPDSATSDNIASEWAIGARVFPPPGLEISQIAGIIYGDGTGGGSAVRLLEPRRWSQEQDSLLAESSDELRTLIKRAEAKIKDLEQVQRNQNDELRRLRSDLDILVNSGKIKDYRGELQRAEASLRQVTEDIRSINQLLSTSGKQTAPPRNFQQREADLIAANLELEKALRDEEGRFYGERAQQTVISPERRKMLADIGRGSSLESLKRDLAALVLKRSKLESGESESE